jgi:hypothetical protein
MPHRAHSFIVDVQPTFPIISVSVRVEYVDRIMPISRGLAVVVKHPIQLVMHRLQGFPGNWCHDVWTQRHEVFSASASMENKAKNHALRDLQLRPELNRFADLNYAIRGRIE